MTVNRAVGLLCLRLLLGVIFFMQGFGKVFSWGVEQVYQSSFAISSYQNFPDWLLSAVAYYTSYVELIAGFLLLIGWWRDYSLYALASVLIIVSFGHGWASPIWDLQHVLFRALLLVSLLLLPKSWDKWTLEALLNKKEA
jgi:putative oxidoreductase